ncbi:MAG TPA: outer membrane beta-barrel protein [Candidatus Dormibacteraeota bacterium]|nr:outer membrane beta-barrel protein [Candidatus Dormibacteraeota bacterium]
MRKIMCLLGLVFLVSVSASAQDHLDVFAGYSYVHTSPGVTFNSFNANGGVASAALHFTSWGSLVAEVGGVHASKINGTDVDATAETYLFGPKISFFSHSKFTPFAQALFGVAHSNAAFNGTATNFNGFAMSPGAGLDWNVTRHFGLRLAQVDYLLTRIPTSTNQVNWNNFRYSAGVVFRF